MRDKTLLIAALVSILWGGAASAQSASLCAGQPCPGSDEAPLEVGESRRPSAVIVDAVVLTPALEKLGARLEIEQAVMGALRDQRWDAVSVARDCRDLGCAGAAAAASKASYAVVLLGRFTNGESYAAGVGVTLMRDGAIVSTENEAGEERDFVAKGKKPSDFARCGPPAGVCTTRLVTAKLQQYAAKLVENESVAIRVRLRVAAAQAAEAKAAAAAQKAAPLAVPPAPPPVAPPQAPPLGTNRKWLGWTIAGIGVALGAGAVALWLQNGDLVDCSGVTHECRRRRDSVLPATTLTVLGAGAIAAGVVIVVHEWPRQGEVSLLLQPSGVSIGGRF